VPFRLESVLVERGAAPPRPTTSPNTVAGGRLVTGQNPASATGTAELVFEVTEGR